MKGLFITFEGPDASGKTTQIGLLEEYLKSAGIEPVRTREPGGTSISEKIREIILDKANGEMLPETEMMLYAASRAQHVGQLIRPALEEGRVVISDRFTDSSVAYQAYGRGLGEAVGTVNRYATGGLEPDITFLLKFDPADMRKRRSAAEEDRMDAEKLSFHRRVLEGYLKLAQENPERIVLLDGSDSPEAIAEIVREKTEEMLRKKGHPGRQI